MQGWANHQMQQTGRRARSRLRVRLAARLDTLSATHRVMLRDISLTGAKISDAGWARVGQDCVLTWDGHDAFGRIVWSTGGHCGIAFDKAIDSGVLIATRDLNDSECLPDDLEIRREAARNFSTGVSRF